MNRILMSITFFFSILSVSVFSATTDDDQKKNDKVTTQNKNITIIEGKSTADGKSEMREQILEECLVSLPRVEDLEPSSSSQSQFLKEINADASKNDFVKTYSASIQINYMVFQKVLYVVTINSINAQEPVMKVMDKNIKQSKIFTSDNSAGDIFAGQSHRQYYFSTPEGASNDVKGRARIWLKEQGAVVCKK